jgi:hypothetical protein
MTAEVAVVSGRALGVSAGRITTAPKTAAWRIIDAESPKAPLEPSQDMTPPSMRAGGWSSHRAGCLEHR